MDTIGGFRIVGHFGNNLKAIIPEMDRYAAADGWFPNADRVLLDARGVSRTYKHSRHDGKQICVFIPMASFLAPWQESASADARAAVGDAVREFARAPGMGRFRLLSRVRRLRKSAPA